KDELIKIGERKKVFGGKAPVIENIAPSMVQKMPQHQSGEESSDNHVLSSAGIEIVPSHEPTKTPDLSKTVIKVAVTPVQTTENKPVESTAVPQKPKVEQAQPVATEKPKEPTQSVLTQRLSGS